MIGTSNANILTPAQIMAYAQNAGFSGDDLNTAVAIALAESSGNANNYNPETGAGAPPGMGSFGLWQIYLNVHPEFSGENLYDPQTNANAAYSIYSAAGGFSPWTTYGSGAYQAYLSSVPNAAPAAAPVLSIPGLTSAVVNDASMIPSDISTDDILLVAGLAIAGIFLMRVFD